MKFYFIKILGITAALFILGCDLMIKDKPVPAKKNTTQENVFFNCIDKGKADPSEDKTIYYKIYLDRELAAKTTSGLFFQKKKLSLRLSAGRYLFFAERWYLEESGDNEIPEYKRANNVWQMKPMYIDIPEGQDSFEMTFGIDHDTKEFYYKIEGKADSIPEIMKLHE